MITYRHTSAAVPRYVLATAARNEEAHIERTISSVLSQTWLPEKWVIVSDGSTDRTDQIIARHTGVSCIELVRLDASHRHSFASKVFALNLGFSRSGQSRDFEFTGNLDADLSFKPDYFERLLGRFRENPLLGIGGGSICEWDGTRYSPRAFNGSHSVAGAVQMFRRECYVDLGKFEPLKYGGEDWCAEITARMKGWAVESFPDLQVIHHRPGGNAGVIRSSYRAGRMDFSIGSHPLFEAVRLARRLGAHPRGFGALARLGGFLTGYVCGEERLVSDELIRFLRREQVHRLRNLTSKGMRALRWAPE